MRDVDSLRAKMAIAVLLGAAACGSSDASDKDAISVDLSKISGGKSSKPDKTPVDDEGDAGDESAAAGSSSGGAIEPVKIDPELYCGAGEPILTKTDASSQAWPGSGIENGCPSQIDNPGSMDPRTLRTFETQQLRDAGDDEHCCYENPPSRRPPIIRRGRPLVADGHELRPDFEVGPRRAAPMGPVRAAAQWLHDARIELASVGSFVRAARELAAVGAPTALVAACLRAADDETRHTHACLAIAERLSGRVLRLGPCPPAADRGRDLYGVLCDTFGEGAVAETSAALVAMRSAAAATDPDIRAALQRIADDEASHAALAWSTIAWGLPRLSATDRDRWLSWAHARAPALEAARGRDPLAAFGRLDAASEAAAAADAWRGVIAPMLASLASPQHGEAHDVGAIGRA